MTDTQTLSITPEQFAALAPTSQTQLEANLSKAGFSAEQIASLKGPGGNTGSGATGNPADALAALFTNGKQGNTDPALRPPATAAAHVGHDKLVSTFKNLIGKVPTEALQKAAAEEGIDWSEVTKEAPAPADKNVTLTEANEKLAQGSDYWGAANDPADFGAFNFKPEHIEGLPPDEVADINGMFAQALSGSVPRNMAQGIVSEAMDAANTYLDMNEDQQRLRFAEEGAKLRRLGNIEKIVADHQLAWSRLPQDFREVATEHRLFHTATSFLALSRAGEMIRLREQRAGVQK